LLLWTFFLMALFFFPSRIFPMVEVVEVSPLLLWWEKGYRAPPTGRLISPKAFFFDVLPFLLSAARASFFSRGNPLARSFLPPGVIPFLAGQSRPWDSFFSTDLPFFDCLELLAIRTCDLLLLSLIRCLLFPHFGILTSSFFFPPG